MDIYHAVILGIIQGITEFFPISSSGHLVILQNLFGLEEPQMAFDIFLHIGTSAAVIIFFRKDILGLFRGDKKTLSLILIATIPTFIIGFFFKDAVEGFFRSVRIAGYMLIVTGIWLGLASRISHIREGKKKELGPANSVMIGISQGVAVIPGISRSGATIATAMLLGIDKEKACRFSFLLSLPAILGAAALKAHKISTHLASAEMLSYLAGGVVAMCAGLAAIKILLVMVRSDRFYFFSVYCLAAGILVLITL